MVDELRHIDEQSAETSLVVRNDNIFVRSGVMQVPGLIENIAQSAAAFTGYHNSEQDVEPKIGYIGEVKNCAVHRLPRIGERIYTRIAVLAEAGGITLMSAISYSADPEDSAPVNDRLLTECQIKIFLKE